MRSANTWLISQLSRLLQVKVRTLDIAALRGTPPQKRSGTDHTVLPANFTVPVLGITQISQLSLCRSATQLQISRNRSAR